MVSRWRCSRRCSSSSTSSPRCLTAKPEFIDLFGRDRDAWSPAGVAPAARLTAARGRAPARPRVAPVLPRGLAHLSLLASRARCSAYRMRGELPPVPGLLPQARPDDPAAVQGGVRPGPPERWQVRVRRDDGGHRAGHPAVHDRAGEAPEQPRRSWRRPRPRRVSRASRTLLDTPWPMVGQGSTGPPGLVAPA